jgi:large subunit ribosomal protein L23
MGLFSRSKETADTATESKATPKVPTRAAAPSDRNLMGVLKKPRITEKAVGKSEQNVYTFEIRQDATKRDVRDAVAAVYNVTPVKVNIVNKRPALRVSAMRRHPRREAGLKKAYVYLKKGDTITLV